MFVKQRTWLKHFTLRAVRKHHQALLVLMMRWPVYLVTLRMNSHMYVINEL